MGGTDDPSNIKLVTIEDHAEEHRKLFEEFDRQEDKIAWLCLSGQINNAEARLLAHSVRMKGKKLTPEHREKVVKTLKNGFEPLNSMFGKYGSDNPHTGMKRSEETKAKISGAMMGNTNKPKKPKQEKLPRKLLLGDLNPSKREDVREKIRLSKLGKKRPFSKRRVRNKQGELVWSNS